MIARRRVAIGALCLAGVALLASCGRVPSYENALVLVVGDPSVEASFRRMVASFDGATRPVRVELQSAQDYHQWMTLQFIGRRPPSILSAGAEISWRFGAHEDALVALDPYLDRENPLTGKPWREQFVPGVLDVCRAPDGRIYVIPFDVVKVAFFYNKRIFAALDLTPPTTWAEFMAVCQRIQDHGEAALGYPVTPLAVGNSVPSGVVMWNLATFCDSLFRPLIPRLDTRKPDKENPGRTLDPDGFIDQEELTRGYKLGLIDPRGPEFDSLWRLYKDWTRYWVKDFNAMRDEDTRPLFYQQRCAIAMDGSWWAKQLPLDLADLPAEKRFEFGVFPLPPVTDESYPHFNHPFGSLGSVGNGLAVANAYGQQAIEEAVALVRHCSTPPVLLEASAALNLPTVKDIELPERYAGFRPLIDGTFPFLRFVENWFPDARASDEWFKLFQGYLGGRLDLETYREQTARVIEQGVERAIVNNKYDTARW